MTHYFTDHPGRPTNRREYSFRFFGVDITLWTADEVFSKDHPDPGSLFLVETVVDQLSGHRLCDLGCGNGLIGILLGLRHPEFALTFCDVNDQAIQLCRENLERMHLQGEVIHRAGLAPEMGHYDVVVSNPPIRIGKVKLYDLFDQVHAHLAPDGSFWFVMRKDQGALSAQRYCEQLFGHCDRMARDRGYAVFRAYF